MPFFVAVNPDTLKVVAMYEYAQVDPSREPDATHIEVVPPMDYRAVLVPKIPKGTSSSLQIQMQ